jgi:ABC-type glutathione transport system ATPase component
MQAVQEIRNVNPAVVGLIDLPASRPVIQLEHIHKTYTMGDVDVHALRGVSLEIREGEFVAIMGASGSGKSTMMNIVGCLDRPTKGTYILDGQDVSQMSKDERADIRSRQIGLSFKDLICCLGPRRWKMSSCRCCTRVSPPASVIAARWKAWRQSVWPGVSRITRTNYRVVSSNASPWPAHW